MDGRPEHINKSASSFFFFKQTEKPIICTANQSGFEADCELENPFKRDSQVHGHFTPSLWCFAAVP